MTKQLQQRFIQMFECDTARISQPGGKMFLIIGHKRHTKDDPGQWERNGEPVDFEYVAEKCVASGENELQLIASAEEYKRLCAMTWEEYFAAKLPA